jgi:hypothetical protein
LLLCLQEEPGCGSLLCPLLWVGTAAVPSPWSLQTVLTISLFNPGSILPLLKEQGEWFFLTRKLNYNTPLCSISEENKLLISKEL